MGELTPLVFEDETPSNRLSERQRQCLELVALGLTSKQIARELGLSPSTVDNHLRAAIERLGLNNCADAVRAMRAGIVKPETVSAPPASANPKQAAQEAVSPARRALQLPPLGGLNNDLSPARRYLYVVQIALLGTMAMTAIVMTIAGLVALFSR